MGYRAMPRLGTRGQGLRKLWDFSYLKCLKRVILDLYWKLSVVIHFLSFDGMLPVPIIFRIFSTRDFLYYRDGTLRTNS